MMENRQTNQATSPGGVGGVGSAAGENQQSARYRQQAVQPESVAKEAAPAKVKPNPKEEVELTTCPNALCNAKLETGWTFCSKCGANLLRHGAAKQLDIELTEQDLEDYLFRGYILREIKVLGKHRATFKSSQANELRHIDDYMMNGSWGKDGKGRDRKVSEFYMRQLNAMCLAAAAMVKFNGDSVGDSFEERISWIDSRGSAFVDLLSQKAALFNQAVSEFLKDQEFVLGS